MTSFAEHEDEVGARWADRLEEVARDRADFLAWLGYRQVVPDPDPESTDAL